jgi:hypothetical protein
VGPTNGEAGGNLFCFARTGLVSRASTGRENPS